ncbi:metal-dependent phosphohydrolase [Streptomyces sp. NPDC051561]|uniref:metal-dependent phosphohydrolase n=1 Tax=Streptomyces sp. NPDC051561 TaxID=3365658 RepID=UPI0037AE0385
MERREGPAREGARPYAGADPSGVVPSGVDPSVVDTSVADPIEPPPTAPHPRRRTPLLVAVRVAAGLLGVAGLVGVVWGGIQQPGIALAFGVLIWVGEAVHRGGEAAPLGTAGALAYALLGHCGGGATTHGVLQVVAVTTLALTASSLPLRVRRPSPASRPSPDRAPLDRASRQILTVGFAAVCFQPLYNSGLVAEWVGQGPWFALLLVGLLGLTGLCDAVLGAAVVRARTGYPYGPLLRDELRALRGIGAAVRASSVVMALAVAVVGLWALPVFCVPLLLTQLSFRRYAEVRDTSRQTIASLARATEVAGYTKPGHARQVAALSEAVGRELGLSCAELTLLEYAALMHDIGQLSLLDPVPAGATASLPVADQRRIALLGGAVVRQTGVPAEVAVVVECQADPYREQPLTARIVRTVNAYVDLSGECGGGPGGPLDALEKLRSGTAHDYQSEVVESLARVLRRGRLARGVALPPLG